MVRYSSNPEVWPGEVISYGVGTFTGLVGVFSFRTWLNSSVGVVKITTKSHTEESTTEQPIGQSAREH